MKEKNLENIVEDLLYEAAARRNLQSASTNRTPRKLVLAAVAVAATLLLLVFAYNTINKSNLTKQRAQLAAQYYEFPVVAKARSMEKNIVDEYITELNAKDYQFVLSKLVDFPLSEKDSFVKAHLYFTQNAYDEARNQLTKTDWKDDYLHNEANWLLFLIALKETRSVKELTDMANMLEGDRAQEAAGILSKL